MKGSRCLWALMFLILGVVSCRPRRISDQSNPASENTRTLIVFAAASLTSPFREIGEAFSLAHPDVDVVYNFAGSQQLAQQILQGAQVDVFASADERHMANVAQGGRVKVGAERIFIRNRLVVIYPPDNPAGIKTLLDLAQPGRRLVFAAEEVPVGRYSFTFLELASHASAFGASYQERVLDNVVSFEENVKAVVSKVALGEADGGIVYISDVSLRAGNQVGTLAIPDALNPLATYPIAIISDGENPALADQFVKMLLGPTGQDILTAHGFIREINN